MERTKELENAVKLVNEAIRAEENRLRKISESIESEPVMIGGETEQGYFMQSFVDPADIAKIMLRHDYSICRVLDMEAPDEMWCELGRFYGLESVSEVDL